MIMKHKTQVQS